MEIQPYEKNGSLSFFTASNLPRKNQGKEIDCFNEFFAITKKIMRSLGFRYKSISFLSLSPKGTEVKPHIGKNAL